MKPDSQARIGTTNSVFVFFPFQLTTSRFGKLTLLIHTLLKDVVTIQTQVYEILQYYLVL